MKQEESQQRPKVKVPVSGRSHSSGWLGLEVPLGVGEPATHSQMVKPYNSLQSKVRKKKKKSHCCSLLLA